ncbi:MAG: hypothetical protein AAF655_06490 [Bacteroidota bacterium]
MKNLHSLLAIVCLLSIVTACDVLDEEEEAYQVDFTGSWYVEVYYPENGASHKETYTITHDLESGTFSLQERIGNEEITEGSLSMQGTFDGWIAPGNYPSFLVQRSLGEKTPIQIRLEVCGPDNLLDRENDLSFFKEWNPGANQ